jgi:aspartokinase
MVSVVGFGLGSRPAAFFAAFNLLRRRAIPVLKSFTTRESICFVVPADRVNEGVLLVHEAFIETNSPQPTLEKPVVQSQRAGVMV